MDSGSTIWDQAIWRASTSFAIESPLFWGKYRTQKDLRKTGPRFSGIRLTSRLSIPVQGKILLKPGGSLDC